MKMTNTVRARIAMSLIIVGIAVIASTFLHPLILIGLTIVLVSSTLFIIEEEE